MEGQAETVGRDDEPHGGVEATASEPAPEPAVLDAQDTELLTRMLYADAIVGVGVPNLGVALRAERAGLTIHDPESARRFAVDPLPHQQWRWDRDKLETLPLNDLIDLYMGIKELSL